MVSPQPLMCMCLQSTSCLDVGDFGRERERDLLIVSLCAGPFRKKPCKEYFAIFNVAYKLVVGFAAVGIINAVFMQETFKVASSDDNVMMRQKDLGNASLLVSDATVQILAMRTKR